MPKRQRGPKGSMNIVTINVPQIYLDFIEVLTNVKDGVFPSRSEFVRVAISKEVELQIKLLNDTKSLIKQVSNKEIIIEGKSYHIKKRLSVNPNGGRSNG